MLFLQNEISIDSIIYHILPVSNSLSFQEKIRIDFEQQKTYPAKLLTLQGVVPKKTR